MNEVKKGCFIVIETDNNNKPIKAVGEICKQTFQTLLQAQQWVENDALDTINRDTGTEFKRGLDETWGSDHIICQVVKIVRPITMVSLNVQVLEVK